MMIYCSENAHKKAIYTPYNKICRYCGQDNLRWGETEEGWRLFTFELKRHICDSWGKQTAATRSKARGI